jgi:hypothetical protein
MPAARSGLKASVGRLISDSPHGREAKVIVEEA